MALEETTQNNLVSLYFVVLKMRLAVVVPTLPTKFPWVCRLGTRMHLSVHFVRTSSDYHFVPEQQVGSVEPDLLFEGDERI